jgi:UDP-N-acetylmuramoyl-tripeptide--D-alanyl-D-alanine ligase
MTAPLMTLGQALALLPQAALVGDPATPLLRVHSDTRTLQPGDLFVALRGERFDAHDFLPQARAAGAAAAIAERGLAEAGLPGLRVPDSLQALQGLAAAWRARLQPSLIAVTGSNGKTTVTQMIACILQAWLGDEALATQGNLNNHIGVPLTLLRLRQDAALHHRAAVLELGMNHPGEIALLAAMTRPTVALVNNAQREHQEFMPGVEAVAHENGAVIQALGPAGVAVYPADDEHAAVWTALAGARPTLTFALQGPADLTAQAQWQAAAGDAAAAWRVTMHTPAGDMALRLQVAGAHNVKNALAAAACAIAAGAPADAVQRGLEAFRPVKGRSQIGRLRWRGSDAALVDDTYNANPDSVRAAIDVLAALPGPRWLLLGDMGEVGDQGPAFHEEVGAYARQRGIDALWAAGELCRHAAQAFGAAARHFDTAASAAAAVATAVTDGPEARAVLVKGSRFMKMEQVVAALQAAGEGTHAG